VNISSLPKHFENLSLLGNLEHSFKVLALSETRLVESKTYPDLKIDGYNFFANNTEASVGGTALSIYMKVLAVFDAVIFRPLSIQLS